jgi:hypothetical protein
VGTAAQSDCARRRGKRYIRSRERRSKKRLTGRREFLIDLSFALGIPEEELAARLTNRSFVRYQHYAAKWMLPARRLELYLAQVALVAAQASGAAGMSLSDFVFDPQEEATEAEAAEFFGFNPRPKKTSE